MNLVRAGKGKVSLAKYRYQLALDVVCHFLRLVRGEMKGDCVSTRCRDDSSCQRFLTSKYRYYKHHGWLKKVGIVIWSRDE